MKGKGKKMTSTKDIGRIIAVDEASVEILSDGADVSYRLIRLDMYTPQYLLIVSDGEDEAILAIGSDESMAKNLFEAFIIGKVSPCTANDLFKDIIL